MFLFPFSPVKPSRSRSGVYFVSFYFLSSCPLTLPYRSLTTSSKTAFTVPARKIGRLMCSLSMARSHLALTWCNCNLPQDCPSSASCFALSNFFQVFFLFIFLKPKRIIRVGSRAHLTGAYSRRSPFFFCISILHFFCVSESYTERNVDSFSFLFLHFHIPLSFSTCSISPLGYLLPVRIGRVCLDHTRNVFCLYVFHMDSWLFHLCIQFRNTSFD